MEKQSRGRGRPSGAKNKTPFMLVPLSVLTEHLATTAKVPVKKSYAIEILGIDDYENGELEDSINEAEDVVEPLPVIRRSREEE